MLTLKQLTLKQLIVTHTTILCLLSYLKSLSSIIMFPSVNGMPQLQTVFLCVTVKWPVIFSPRHRHTVTSPVTWLCFIWYTINLSYVSQNFTLSRGSSFGLHPVGRGSRIPPADSDIWRWLFHSSPTCPAHPKRITLRASLLVSEKNKWRYFNLSLN